MNENEKLLEILRLSSELNTVHDVDILLEKILLEARKCVNADAGTIYERDGDYLVFSYTQNNTLQKKLAPGKKLPFQTYKLLTDKSTISGYVASTGEILNMPDVTRIPDDSPYNWDSSYEELTHYKVKSMLTVPLQNERGDLLGVLQVINSVDKMNQFIPFNKDDELFVFHFANMASLVLQRSQMTRALLLRMISMAELRDPKETGAHVNRVASYSVEIYENWAFNMGLPKQEVNRNKDILRMAAMVHDVGKMAISDLILKKPSKLTDDEYETMKNHTHLGSRLFKDKQSDFDEIAADVALTHHENWDGTGYPGHVDINTGIPLEKDSKGNALPKKGKDISIFGRVVALADVYDALISKRVYKEAWDEKSVLVEIKRLSGNKFDPDLVDTFFDSLDIIRSIPARYPEDENTE